MNPPRIKYIICNIFLFLLIFGSLHAYCQQGKDGAKTITGANTIVNDYTSLTADANSGTNTLQVANNSLSNGFSSSLSAGDLIFIIQVQGASINTSDNSSYGDISSYNNCGNNEFAEVNSVSGTGTIGISCPLQNSYTYSSKVEVIRVPRYSSLTVNAGAGITCPTWGGVTGGIVVIEVLGATVIDGIIDVSGKGFHGGAINDNNSAYGVLNYVWPNNDYGGEKGEGIAGSVTDYDAMGGRYCKGAPANGGGGANAHNTGGGGGANAGNISSYTGFGVPDNTNVNWTTAWNLESPGFAATSSSGGGRGGYGFSDSNQNALVLGPGNTAWAGASRPNAGGFGGRPLDYSGGRIFMGGGGGAGEQNDQTGGPGGNGGGIISLLTFSTISGTGQVKANGNNGSNTLTAFGPDGAGGGGGGGAIILNSTGNVSNIAANANGGNGGNQTVFFFVTESEGPGGGGGGGYIALANGSITRNTNGGVSGITNSSSLTEFPPNGATNGNAGINNATLNSFYITTQPYSLCNPGSTSISFVAHGTPPAGITYVWYDQPVGGTQVGTGNTFNTPFLNSSTTYYVSYCPGTSRLAVPVNVSSGVSASFTVDTVCAGTSFPFNANTSGNINFWKWEFNDGSPPDQQQNTTHTFVNPGSYTVTLSVSDGICTTSASNVMVVVSHPVANFTSSASGSGCGSSSVQFTNASSGASSYSWDFGDGSPASSQTSPAHTYTNNGSFNVVLTASNAGCSDDTTISINANSGPAANFTASSTNGCAPFSVTFTNSTAGTANYTWNFGDGSPASTQTNPNHTYTATGSYSVTLIATQGTCSDTAFFPNLINVTGQPSASFSAPSSTCSGDSIAFTDLSTISGGSISSYTWDFGDGGSSNISDPNHLYASNGTFNVHLTVASGSCTDDTTISITISPTPVVNYTSSVTNACDSATVQFTNTTTGASSYSWQFGDGGTSTLPSPVHTYSTAGNFTVILTATSGSCSVTGANLNMIRIHSTPIAAFTASNSNLCKGECISFTGNSTPDVTSWTWTFQGSSTPSSATQNPPNICYPNAGVFDVTLQVTNGYCTSTHFELTFINVADCSVMPHAAFIREDSVLCLNGCTDFVSLSSNAISWQWSFPGAQPSTSTAEHPSNICYQSPGNYDVTLIVGNTTGHDTLTYPNFVNVYSPPAAPSFTQIGDTLYSTPAPHYQWYLNNIAISGATSQQFIAMLSGDYSVVVTDAGGCTATSSAVHINVIGIEEAEENLYFYLYPNPVTSELSVLLYNKKPSFLTVSLFDAIGKVIFSENIPKAGNEQTLRYDLRSISAGIYFLEIQSPDHKWIRPVVRQ